MVGGNAPSNDLACNKWVYGTTGNDNCTTAKVETPSNATNGAYNGPALRGVVPDNVNSAPRGRNASPDKTSGASYLP